MVCYGGKSKTLQTKNLKQDCSCELKNICMYVCMYVLLQQTISKYQGPGTVSKDKLRKKKKKDSFTCMQGDGCGSPVYSSGSSAATICFVLQISFKYWISRAPKGEDKKRLAQEEERLSQHHVQEVAKPTENQPHGCSSGRQQTLRSSAALNPKLSSTSATPLSYPGACLTHPEAKPIHYSFRCSLFFSWISF